MKRISQIIGFVLLLSFLVSTQLTILGQVSLADSYKQDVQISYDRDPDASIGFAEPDRAPFDLLFEFPHWDASGEYPVATDGNYIYTAMWNSTEFYRYEMDGTYVETFFIPGAGNLRDLTHDGTYFYGSPNSSTIYELCLATETLISSFTTPATSNVRAIAHDGEHDGFWVSNGWNPPLTRINRTGAVQEVLSTTATSFAGLAWDNYSDAGAPYLWAYSQTIPNNLLYQIDINTGATLQTFDVTTVVNISTGSSGGMDITDLAYPGKWAFLGAAQNDIVWCLELTDADFVLPLPFYEDFTGVPVGQIPAGWTRDIPNFGVSNTSSAGGAAPEMQLFLSPSQTPDKYYLTTPRINTGGYSKLELSFKHLLQHWSGTYTLKVATIANGVEYLIDEWINPTGWPATDVDYILTAADHGVGTADFQLAWVIDGNPNNLDWWRFDNIALEGIPKNIPYYEDFTGVPAGEIPAGWTRDINNFAVINTNLAGGAAPEMRLNFSPSQTPDLYYLKSPVINTSGFTILDFSFKHLLTHFSGPYTLKVVSIADGAEHLIDEWVNPTSWSATEVDYVLTAADHGVGAEDFRLAWVIDGNPWNMNNWNFDDISLREPATPLIPQNLTADLNNETGEVQLNWEYGGFYDDFCEDSGYWRFSDERFSIENCELKMTGKTDGTWASAYFNYEFTDFVFEYEVTRHQSNVTTGLSLSAFLRTDGFWGGNANGYMINITANGSYSAWKWVNGSESNLIPWTTSPHINTGLGASNIVTIHASGTLFEIYINGQYIAEFNDATHSDGYVGLGSFDSGSGENIVTWDYAQLEYPNNKLVRQLLSVKESQDFSANINNHIISDIGEQSSKFAPDNGTPVLENSVAVKGLLRKGNLPDKQRYDHFKIFRNGVFLDTAPEMSYNDQLPAYGQYSYHVTAVLGGFESDPSEPADVNWEEPPTYTLTLVANPSAGGTVDGAGDYEEGEQVTISATSNTGWQFINWTGDIGHVANPNSAVTTVTMPAQNITLTANFEQLPPDHYILTLLADPVEGGSVEGGGTYQQGDKVTITATPNTGWKFIEWTGDIAHVANPNSAVTTVTMPAEHITLTANFEQVPTYMLTLEANPPEGGSVDGGGEYPEGEVVVIVATANEGWFFVEWTGDIAHATHPNSAVTIVNMPAEDIVLTANFEEIPLDHYSLTLFADPPEGGTVSGTGVYPAGQEITITATPEENWEFINWTGDIEYVDNPGSNTTMLNMPDKNITLTANFLFVSVKDETIAELKIYPNPARNKVYIESSKMIKQIRLINISGQVVKDISVDALNTEINVNNFKTGIYFMQIHIGERIITERVQITR